jgi:hypothetical protein
MEIVNNIEWFFNAPKNAIIRDTMRKITKNQLKEVVFDDSVKENINFCFPLNDDFTFTETRELSRPITVEQLLIFIQDFYHEPLSQEHIDKSFGENVSDKNEWKNNMIESHNDCDISHLTKIDLFDTTCTPDFCGIHLSQENPDEYFIGIGPE